MDLPASVANKRLTVGLSPLDATLTKNTGVGVSHLVRNSPLITRHCNGERNVFLTNRLLMPGGGSHGFIHMLGGLFAGIALALVAALQILKIILQNFRAGLAHASSGGLIQ